ncbi:MAG: pip [Mucilaginibacter sp.]|jgi:pimeloyl-ACP methyl ester carboxylesterase|nr:pip [Mucilaginibacter sp.]MDB5017881.1 pip [Mucilaginibacter sp.]
MVIKRFLFIIMLIAIVLGGCKQTPIDKTEIIPIGGIKQFIDIKGADSTKPLLLFITGGPGESSIGSSDVFTNELKKHFIVVQWDQRECGETLKLNKSPQPITLARCEQDTHELIDFLLNKFHRRKIFLMGWSWGTVLGFNMAENYPDKLYAYLAVSPVVNQAESERIALQMLKEEAVQNKNEKAINELAGVNIPFRAMDLYYDRKWMFIFDGQKVNEKDLKSHFTDPTKSWITPLFAEAMGHNLTTELQSVKCPVYFFVGGKDYQTNRYINQAYYHQLSAPKKQLFLFPNSGHSVPYSDPALFQQDIISKILPEVD